jgi:hypothetical protein
MADEPFKATEEDWAYIEWAGGITDAHSMRTIRELRDRVAALEAERVAPEASTTAPTPPAAVPSDEELWGVQLKACKQVEPGMAWLEWNPDRECSCVVVGITANRALYDHGFQHGLAAGRAEQGGTPEPEPNQAPAGDGGLVDTISDIIENEPIIGRPPEEEWKPEARAIILAVARWLRGSGHFCAATDLEREAQR